MAVAVDDADRALLWLAARVVGLQTEAQRIDQYRTDAWLANWSPLQDDAAAHRLVLALGRIAMHRVSLEITCGQDGEPAQSVVTVADVCEVCELHDADPAAATRRAIVRAAADSGLQRLQNAERVCLGAYGGMAEALQRLSGLLRESLDRFRAQALVERAAQAAEASAACPQGAGLAAPDESARMLQGKRLFGRGTNGLQPDVIDELLATASASGYRLYLLAGNEDWVKQDYLIVSPDDLRLLPQHLGEPYLAMASGQGFSIYPIDTKILQKPFNVVRISSERTRALDE
jgi:hypothetical protein